MFCRELCYLECKRSNLVRVRIRCRITLTMRIYGVDVEFEHHQIHFCPSPCLRLCVPYGKIHFFCHEYLDQAR